MTGSESLREGHIVAFTLPFWGHTKPLCALLAKIIRVKQINITLFAAENMHEKAVQEVDRQFNLEEEKSLRDWIRIAALPRLEDPFIHDELQIAFIAQYKKLWAGESIAVSYESNKFYEAVVPPQLVILDFFCYKSMVGIRGISGSSVPVYAWQSCASASLLFLSGPEEFGGYGDLAEKIEKIEAEDDETREEKICEIYRKDMGNLVKLPGIPPMYDYEYRPQLSSSPVSEVYLILFLQHVHRFFKESDGILHQSNVHFEGGVLEKWQEWLGDRPSIAIGPVTPMPTLEEVKMQIASDDISSKVESFLNDAYDTHGPNSVVYVSFGTVWWSPEPEKIWAVIETLIEKGVPFLFSHASPAAIIPEDIAEKVKMSGKGFMSRWLPQQMILRHKACGWFLTHCGHNSVTESLLAGIPMICWPFDGDQPFNAANVCGTHDAGYELLEVRLGNGLRPIHRLGDKCPEGTVDAVRREMSEVLDMARGEDGLVKRQNAQRLGELFSETWSASGPGWVVLKDLVKSLH